MLLDDVDDDMKRNDRYQISIRFMYDTDAQEDVGRVREVKKSEREVRGRLYFIGGMRLTFLCSQSLLYPMILSSS